MNSIVFTQVLKDWQLFFSTVALASVTLAGLLFVSLSLRFDRLSSDSYAGMMRLARTSFSDFLYVLMLGLIFLVPHPVPFGLAVALFVMAAARAAGMVRRRSTNQGDSKIIKTRKIVRETVLSGVAIVGMAVVAIEILRGDLNSIFLLVLVIAALLTTASWNAWLILVGANLKEA
jgi:hypothetical protein